MFDFMKKEKAGGSVPAGVPADFAPAAPGMNGQLPGYQARKAPRNGCAVRTFKLAISVLVLAVFAGLVYQVVVDKREYNQLLDAFSRLTGEDNGTATTPVVHFERDVAPPTVTPFMPSVTATWTSTSFVNSTAGPGITNVTCTDYPTMPTMPGTTIESAEAVKTSLAANVTVNATSSVETESLPITSTTTLTIPATVTLTVHLDNTSFSDFSSSTSSSEQGGGLITETPEETFTSVASTSTSSTSSTSSSSSSSSTSSVSSSQDMSSVTTTSSAEACAATTVSVLTVTITSTDSTAETTETSSAMTTALVKTLFSTLYIITSGMATEIITPSAQVSESDFSGRVATETVFQTTSLTISDDWAAGAVTASVNSTIFVGSGPTASGSGITFPKGNANFTVSTASPSVLTTGYPALSLASGPAVAVDYCCLWLAVVSLLFLV